MAQTSRRKKSKKGYTLAERKFLNQAFTQMRKNGVIFLTTGSSTQVTITLEGAGQKVSYQPVGFKVLTPRALVQRANSAIKYKKKK